MAREGLANLANGPVFLAGGHAAASEARSGPDRERILLAAHEALKKMLPQPAGSST